MNKCQQRLLVLTVLSGLMGGQAGMANCPPGQQWDQNQNQCVPIPQQVQHEETPAPQRQEPTPPPQSPLTFNATPNIIPIDQTPFNNPLAMGQGMTPAETTGGLYKLIEGVQEIPDIDTTLIEGREHFLEPKEKISMNLLDYQLTVEPEAKVLVIRRVNNLAICNLYDKRTGAVKVVAGNKVLTVTPGQQLVLTKHGDLDFDRNNPSFGIGYRNLERHELGAGVTAFVSDFCIVSAVQTSRHLKSLMKSGKREHQATVRTLLRNAVMISHLSNSPQPFTNSFQVLSQRHEWPALDSARVATAPAAAARPAERH